jgi:hypothetical protein
MAGIGIVLGIEMQFVAMQVMLDSNLATATALLPSFANAFGGAVFVSAS